MKKKSDTLTVEQKAEYMIQQIADASIPGKMTVREAREFYEHIASWLEGSLEGLEDDEREDK